MARDGDILVWITHRADSVCGRCKAELPRGEMLQPDGDGATCLACAGLADLVFLPSGDAALTRRAVKASPRHAVVLRFSSARKRHERQGVLVEAAALEAARTQNDADATRRAEARTRAAAQREREDAEYRERFAAALGARWPGCPAAVVQRIVAHACAKYSGRVGRSAMAKELAPEAIDLAVRAHARHTETDYDHDLAEGVERSDARAGIARDLEAVLARWRGRSR